MHELRPYFTDIGRRLLQTPYSTNTIKTYKFNFVTRTTVNWNVLPQRAVDIAEDSEFRQALIPISRPMSEAVYSVYYYLFKEVASLIKVE